MAEQLHAFAFPFQTKINVNPESPIEEFPLQEIVCQTQQNDSVQEKQEALKDEKSEGLKNSPLRALYQEQIKREETENQKFPDIQKKEEQKESSEVFSPPKSSIFNEERCPINLNVEALKSQREKVCPRMTLFEDDLIDEDANHLLRYYH